MARTLLVILIACIGFVSCDGRKSKSVALKESIKEFQQKLTPLATFYPKEYTEVVTDTLISNSVKVHVKNYSSLNDVIPMTSADKNPKAKTFHRVFESEIAISTNTKEIFRTKISADQFKNLFNDTFWNNATLQHTWVNEELSTAEEIHLDMSFIDPTTDSYKLYRMSVTMDGQQHLKLIQEHI